jgi:hypothetical protein
MMLSFDGSIVPRALFCKGSSVWRLILAMDIASLIVSFVEGNGVERELVAFCEK